MPQYEFGGRRIVKKGTKFANGKRVKKFLLV